MRLRLLLILLLALALRIGFAVDQVRKIPREALAEAPFAQETGNIGYSLAIGKGFSNPFRRETGPTAWLTPVYPLIVAATFKIFGIFTVNSFFFLVFLNILFSTAVCVPLFFTGEHIASNTGGLIAASLWAIFPAAVMMPFEWIWDTSLAALIAVTILWRTVKLPDSDRLSEWWLYGLLCGFALMTNPSLGSLLPFLLGWTAYRAYRLRGQNITAPAVALLVAVLCCTPWTVRNYANFHRFVPLRSNFPLELYIGNNENYDDKHPHFPGLITKERETLRYFRFGEIPFMDEEWRKAKTFILTHPRVELKLFAYRFAEFWTGLPNATRTFLEADWLIRTLLLCALLSGLGAAVGLLLLVTQRSTYAFPLAVYPLIFPVLYYITHNSLRYRHPIDPVLLLLTSITFVTAFQASLRFLSHSPETK